MSLEPGTRLGRYRVESPLGAGGMGEVYRARDPKLGRDVAIKVLPAEYAASADRLARFEREARAAGALNHPNVLSIYDVDTHDGAPFVVSELLEGQTLRARMGGAALPLREALDYAAQIARGLAAAHELEIVHRDIKPENIFVTRDGRAKILDFGLAKLAERDGDAARTDLPTRRAVTASGEVMGTVGYMSPEQLRAQAVDARTDIFSFGAVFYEMIAGRRAFHGDSAADTISAILREDPPEFAETGKQVNPGVERVVRRCLEKNRERRFHSASDLAFAIESLSGAQSSAADATASSAAAASPASTSSSEPTIPRRQSQTKTTTAGASLTPAWPRGLTLDRAGWIAAGLLLVSTLALAFAYTRRPAPRPAETMRFALPAPEKGAYNGSLALSPDGRRLAFVVDRGLGEEMLWVRSLDSTEARELPGTEGVAQPFWSPDGRFVAFFAGNKLKKIEASGGPVQIVTEVASAEARGGAWGADGTIVFTPGFTSPLYKVPAAGGAAVPLTELDQSRGETSHRWPAFLPGGRRFLFFTRSPQKNVEGVYAGSLDSRETRLVLNTNLLAAYVPPADGRREGHLLYMRDSTLVAQPFGAEDLRLSGEPAPLAEGVLNYPTEGGPTGYAAFSASANGHLVYLVGSARATQLAWHDRGGKQLALVGPQGSLSEPAIAPDGKRIAVGRDDGQTADVWVLDAARGTATRLTFDPAGEVCPAWSGDGERVVFSSNRGGKPFRLFWKPASGAGDDEQLPDPGGQAFADDWLDAGDGRQLLLFEFEDPKTKFDLYVLPFAGGRAGNPTPLLNSEFNETHAQFSPDGRFVAYVSDESGRAEVYVRTFPDARGKWQVSAEGGDQPQWRGDGRELYYVSADKRLTAVPVTASAGSFEVGAPAALFPVNIPSSSPTGARNNYVAASDGRRFLVNTLAAGAGTQQVTLVLNWAAGVRR